MNFPAYFSSNKHRIVLYGRLFFTVSSNSRKDLIHFVDLEESEECRARYLCTCEAFKYGERPCRHIAACFEALSFWCGVRSEIRDEWINRLVFLLSLGHSFQAALESTYLHELSSVKPEIPAPEKKKVREYTLGSRKPKRFGN